MRKISHIVIHTAATPNRSIDISAKAIKDYHTKVKGWSDCGYHWVCRFNGDIEDGRPESVAGAGVAGFNSCTLHLCFSGNGDLADLTQDQKISGSRFVARKLVEYGIADEFLDNPMRVLGHREVNLLPRVPKTSKSCPGRKVSCTEFRKAVITELQKMQAKKNP
jgi:N-acetylmuramoyl-L-alanine amidase